ncbi:MAG: flagellar motor switch protein FliN [Planctomycetes bacterium]|nr:flagellar motor switch protein FliN [Planctomycetota bacterium]
MTADEASEVLGDVPVEISIELGRVKLTIGELMDLRRGAVVDLDRLAGEPVDVLANGTVVARGEVVLVNDYYSVRITDIVDEDQ